MSELHHTNGRSARLERVLHDLLAQAPEFQAAAVVSFDGLPMASALPYGMDEDRVAAMSAALLSLGERAADNFGRGALTQVYVEGENGTVFLVSADDEAVLVAVGAKGAKVGLLMFEVRRSAARVAEALRADDLDVLVVPDDVPHVVSTPDLGDASFQVDHQHVVHEHSHVVEEQFLAPVPEVQLAEVAPVDYGTYVEPTTTPYYAPAPPASPWGNPLTSAMPSEANGHHGANGSESGNWS